MLKIRRSLKRSVSANALWHVRSPHMNLSVFAGRTIGREHVNTTQSFVFLCFWGNDLRDGSLFSYNNIVAISMWNMAVLLKQHDKFLKTRMAIFFLAEWQIMYFLWQLFSWSRMAFFSCANLWYVGQLLHDKFLTNLFASTAIFPFQHGKSLYYSIANVSF